MAKISGFAPALPTHGLSFGTEPSALMRTTLPSVPSIRWACMRPSVIERSPPVMKSVPSRAKTSRPPKCLVEASEGVWRQITCTPSRRGAPASRTSLPRATAAWLVPSPLASA